MKIIQQITSILSLSLLILGGILEYKMLIFMSLAAVLIGLAVITRSSRKEILQDARENQIYDFVFKD